jgi:8-oxo-dGTP diphosphatase
VSVIAVAVVVRHGCVLVGRRSENAPEAAGLDEFPGGKVEAGESPASAAARECLEESGIVVRIDGLLHRASGVATHGPLEILFFAASALDDREEPLVPFAWIPITELAGRCFPPANARVVELLAQGRS